MRIQKSQPAATIAKDGKHHTIEMLSEKSMCNSCKSVMNEFKTRYPNVDITVVSYASEKAKNNYNNNQSFKDDVRRIYTDANRRWLHISGI